MYTCLERWYLSQPINLSLTTNSNKPTRHHRHLFFTTLPPPTAIAVIDHDEVFIVDAGPPPTSHHTTSHTHITISFIMENCNNDTNTNNGMKRGVWKLNSFDDLDESNAARKREAKANGYLSSPSDEDDGLVDTPSVCSDQAIGSLEKEEVYNGKKGGEDDTNKENKVPKKCYGKNNAGVANVKPRNPPSRKFVGFEGAHRNKGRVRSQSPPGKPMILSRRLSFRISDPKRSPLPSPISAVKLMFSPSYAKPATSAASSKPKNRHQKSSLEQIGSEKPPKSKPSKNAAPSAAARN